MPTLTQWPTLPDDVIDFFRSAFEDANRHVTERLLNVPNIRETSLDDALIDSLVPFSPARRLASGAVVAMDIHNIGGLRRLGGWETADISVIVFVYRHTQLIAQKIGMLQSKRLYPKNNDVADDDPIGFLYGMNAFLKRQPKSPLALLNRQFEFDDTCVYGAIKAEDRQVKSIAEMNKKLGQAVYYLFYNPPSMPQVIKNAGVERQQVTANDIGCRVYTENEVNAAIAGFEKGRSPTFSQISAAGTVSNWRLETWAADLLLKCQVGQIFDEADTEKITELLVRRTGPIGASIAVLIALPEEGPP
ncbi:hypothetical protein [Methylobacterium bullatum]|uniref:Uncharacterized protein n=1 Tax=Methylobacterium bullatum TaxID=570505 RepID=A0A679JY42_9HYPH|nr:hypothetical protein MBLL_00407 [Methylobacterium bullatum]